MKLLFLATSVMAVFFVLNMAAVFLQTQYWGFNAAVGIINLLAIPFFIHRYTLARSKGWI